MDELTIKSIKELSGMNFFIPAYQRGYRWTERQVIDLLNDIKEFITEEKEGFYCIQPMVIKMKENNCWEVIDGQQRLTSIYIILSVLEHSEKFGINYETREKSKEFLINISEEYKDENIDYYHMVNAKKQVENFFLEFEDLIERFLHTLLNDVRFIWYQTDEADPVKVFTRLNIGKIPLTNSELIKALFLNRSNFKNSSDIEKIRLKQLEIASEWDNIENSLQDDAFWYFLNKEDNFANPRIEFLFDLNADKKKNSDEYFTFRYFTEKLNDKNELEILEYWKEIKNCFNRLYEWFRDRNQYHLIGFLVTTGTDIREFVKKSEDKTKSEFSNYLKFLIKKEIDFPIDTLEYGKDSNLIRKILLLHNIQTMLNNENESNRFPFDRYKKECWDIEHIRAIAEKMPIDKVHQVNWLKESKQYISDKTLIKEIDLFLATEDNSAEEVETFENLFNIIINYFNKAGFNQDTINDISNLVLLDSKTNRSYKNAVFPVKRKTIIEREKNGTFVPLCTKNIFLKFYSEDVSNMNFWDDHDRNSYLNNIIETLKTYS
jgi:uncharacterized protein with ParB-like and HNH nuclease domain